LFELWLKFKFKKLVISFKVIEEIEIISLCSQIKVLLKENYFKKSFLINAFLISQSNSFSLRSLIDSDFIVYMLIHDKLVNKVCQKLEIQFILLAKEKLIWDYDEKLVRKTITHKILLNLTIESHKKLTMLMLIVDIEHHEAILIIIIIIIINSYIFVTLIKSIHERLYAIYIEWAKLSEIENHSLFIRLLSKQNRKREKVDISWFLPTFPELAVNLMCQLTIKISWLSQLLADY